MNEPTDEADATHRQLSRWRFGPGLLVTAAFVGPGTLATASRAGGQFGFSLLWAIGFAVVATIILQEMAARLGVVARLGLAEAIRDSIRPQWARYGALTLVLSAVVLGNTAYQTGNLLGAGVGLSLLTGFPAEQNAALIGMAIALLLALGGTGRSVQGGLIAVVLAMSAAILGTAVASRPDPLALLEGAFVPSLPAGSLLTTLALIGTTVVPYNLFLHAMAVQQRWPASSDPSRALRACRLDAILAITLGGLVTMAVVVTAAAAFHGTADAPIGPREVAEQLQPLLGTAGKALFAAGLAAAGLKSAITAPLAAGYAAAGSLVATSNAERSEWVVRVTAVLVATIGTGLACFLGKSPLQTIVAAQAANGLLLPLVALFLLWVMNSNRLLGAHRNHLSLNLLAVAVVLVAIGLGGKSLLMLLL